MWSISGDRIKTILRNTCVCALIILSISKTQANQSYEDIYQAQSGWHLGMAAGYGKVDNPVYQGRDIPLVLIPKLEFYWGDFAINNSQLIYTPWQNHSTTFSFLTRINEDGLYFIDDLLAASAGAAFLQRPFMSDGDPNQQKGITPPLLRRGDMERIDDRKISVLAGMEVNHDWQDWRVSAAWYQEISNYHHGDEAFLSIAKAWHGQSHLWLTSLELQYQSEDLLQYYYGTRLTDWIAGFSRFQPDSALNTSIKISYRFNINPQWDFIAEARAQHLDSSLNDSPLLEQQHLYSFFAGFAWSY
ncbi:MipA/OmpV family protein [Thalassotalea sp. PS06]|uniref:MipA/OmpV family protein n=1 Tax=Thalassotalea sp. PS06 TaxID=2594005 RepID=UPI0011647434|nr:MipA/OmpV family protein [Thalassotalea sp. PS06]QDP00770.1 MipA/OmpV family protein [Thalassotalea sp. PS06]